MIPNRTTRPRVGQAVTLVIASQTFPQVAGAKVIFDRGRGLIVEATHPIGSAWVRKAPIIMSYESSRELCTFPVTLAEVISAKRAYLQPRADPSPMERREFLRVDVTVQAAIATHVPLPTTPPKLTPTLLDLSPSGFRWFGYSSVALDDPVRLYLQLPDGFEKLDKHVPSANGNLLILNALVVRADRGSRPETAAVFTSATTSDREAILDVLLIAGILKNMTV